MDEKNVKKELLFLIKKYGMDYIREDFKLHDSLITETYSFYNKNGCFTISNFAARGEVDYFYLHNINLLKSFMYSNYNNKKKAYIDITSVQKQIWVRHTKVLFFKNPFFWLSSRKVLKALADVIEAQIQSTGQFFGIKMKE